MRRVLQYPATTIKKNAFPNDRLISFTARLHAILNESGNEKKENKRLMKTQF